MSRLLRGELRKLATVSTTWWIVLAFVVLMLLYATFPLLIAQAGLAVFSLEEESVQRSVLAAPTFGGMLALLLGIVGTAGQHRHGTVVWDYLAVPRRRRVLVAKAAAYGVAGAALGVLGFVLVGAVATVALVTTATPLAVPAGDIVTVMGAIVVYLALSGVIGVGVGELVRSQVVALACTVGVLFLVEPLLLTLVPSVARWLPGNAGYSLAAADVGTVTDPSSLAPAVGGLVYALYAAAAVAAAAAWRLDRDVRG